MISVERGPEPEGFAAHAAKWWNEFEEKQQKYSLSTFWVLVRKRKAMRQYADVLFKVFRNKCAFCESKMKHVSPAHIEHYRPKEKDQFPELMFVWENWLLSCPTCNANKGTKFPLCDNEPCFLDPTVENPDEHLDFLRAQILSKTTRGRETIKEIKLYRTDLEQQRKWWLMQIDILLLLARFIPEAYTEARELLIWSMQPDAPYMAMTYAYLTEITPKLAHPEIPHPLIEINNPLERITKLVEQYNNQLRQLT